MLHRKQDELPEPWLVFRPRLLDVRENIIPAAARVSRLRSISWIQKKSLKGFFID